MKRKYKRLSKFVFLIFCTLLIGCGVNTKEEQETDTIKIGIAIYRVEDPFVASIYKEIEEKVIQKEEGIGKKILLNMVDAKNNQGNQNNQVDEFINKRYDVICVNLVDRTAAALIIAKAKEADIPIVFFNREPVSKDMDIWNSTYYVGSDSKQAGQLAGELVLEAYEKDPIGVDKNNDGVLQYVMLEGEQGHPDALIRTEYSVKRILEQGVQLEKLASGTANWMRSPAYELMLGWIREYGSQIEVVIANNDEMAIGALEAIDEYIMMDPIVIGTDGIESGLEKVEKGLMYGTVVNDAPLQAEKILDLAIASVQGETNGMSRIVKTGHHKITQENLTK